MYFLGMVYFCVPKPFDASTKFLVELHPEDWVEFLNLPRGIARVVDADISTITAAGDRIIEVKAPDETYGLHLEFQAGADSTFVKRLWNYNVSYTVKLDYTVRSVAVLLRPFHNHQEVTGRRKQESAGDTIHDFTYTVLRVWETPPEVFLNGGLALLPLAAVADVGKKQVAGVVEQIEERLEKETKPSEGDLLRTALSVLLGLRYEKSFVEQIMGKSVLELSSVYKAAVKEGKEQGLQEGKEQGLQEGKEQGLQEGKQQGLQEGHEKASRALLLRLGRKRLGEPSAEMLSTIEGITQAEVLDQLAERVLDIESWSELLPQK
jgi:predicted transposase YdaD